MLRCASATSRSVTTASDGDMTGASGQDDQDGHPWWRSAVVYQIYPRSFRDTSGNGIGDLRGVIDGLGHIARLGVDAIWLSPVFRSPMVDHGYDVSDYCDIDPLFGSLSDFDELVEKAHDRDLRVILDWVPNHTSDQHPWFLESRSSRDNPRRDWYFWRDSDPDTPPNNWVRAFPFGDPAWSYDDTTGAWFLHLFSPEQPDLNWSNPDVRAALHDTLRFWLARGVDGFRMDVIHNIGKDPALPDLPDDIAVIPATALIDEPATHDYLREMRALLDEYPSRPVMLGEVYLLDTAQVAPYYGDGDELHLSFNFSPMFSFWDADMWRQNIATTEELISAAGNWPTWVLSNHDNPRHRTRYGGDEAIARAAAVLLLTLRGTPFLYAGEELGLEDAEIPPERIVDPSGGRRDGCRAPIPWTPGPDHGWASADTWLPFPPDSDRRNVETEDADPTSMLSFYRVLLAVRAGSDALRLGGLDLLDAPDGVVAWRRSRGGDERLVLINFTAEPRHIDIAAGHGLDISSHPERDAESTFDGALRPHEAVILSPVR